MQREVDSRTAGPVTDVPADLYFHSDGLVTLHNNLRLRSGIQKTLNSLIPNKPDSTDDTKPKMDNISGMNVHERNVYHILNVNAAFFNDGNQKSCGGMCCKEGGPSCTEAGNCELKRTIQLMEAPSGERNRRGVNLVKRNYCWSGLARISWNCLFTLTLCIISMFVINQPVAAERPFHHRNMRDEAILNPASSHVSVDNLQAATKYLIQYGYLRCNAPQTSETRTPERGRSSRTRRQINFKSFPEVPEGEDPVPVASPCTYTSQQVHASLREFQLIFKLPVTGILDHQTLNKMNVKRCGNVDVINGAKEEESESTLHRAVKRSVGKLRRAKRKATLLIEEKRKQRALHTMKEKESKSTQSSLLSKLLLPKSKPRLSQSAKRRLQIIKDYQRQFQEEDSTQVSSGNKRRGGFVSSKHKEAVILDASADHQRRKRSTPYSEANLRFNLGRQDCIRWRLLNSGYSKRLPVDSQKTIFNTAFRMWAEVTPLCFVEDSESSSEDLDIAVAFGTKSHQGCPFNFDGPSGVLAHNVNFMMVQHIHLDDEEPWKLDSGEDGVNLLKIAVHEIGHVLGLNHIGRDYSVMFPMYNGIAQFHDFELGWEDRKEVQSIYGVCTGRFDVIFDWVRIDKRTHSPSFNSYFFRSEKYWMYENRYNRTRYGDPLFTLHEWPGVPPAIDSYVQVMLTNNFFGMDPILEIRTMFFSGEYVYHYDDDNDRVRENGTALIRDNFPALRNVTEVYPPGAYPHAVSEHIPSNLDAVLWSIWDERLIFFKDEWVYTMDPAVGGCCEEKMLFRDKFPTTGLDGYLDTAFYAHFQSTLFMLKGDDVYEAEGFGYYIDPVLTPLPRHNNTLVHFVDKWYNIWYDICEVSVTTEYAIRSETETMVQESATAETTISTTSSPESAVSTTSSPERTATTQQRSNTTTTS